MARIGDVHVGLGPIPEGVEFFFLVELDGDHHAVGHAFGAHVVIGPIGEVGERAVGVFAHEEEYGLGLRIAVEELGVGDVDFARDFAIGVAGFGEEISVVMRGVSASAVDGSWRGCLRGNRGDER
jgi:hypothetical protein